MHGPCVWPVGAPPPGGVGGVGLGGVAVRGSKGHEFFFQYPWDAGAMRQQDEIKYDQNAICLPINMTTNTRWRPSVFLIQITFQLPVEPILSRPSVRSFVPVNELRRICRPHILCQYYASSTLLSCRLPSRFFHFQLSYYFRLTQFICVAHCAHWTTQ